MTIRPWRLHGGKRMRTFATYEQAFSAATRTHGGARISLRIGTSEGGDGFSVEVLPLWEGDDVTEPKSRSKLDDNAEPTPPY